jgi:hypothetical protein
VADEEALRYRKLVLDEDGCAVGAILLGHPSLAPAVTAAVRERRVLADGGWDALSELNAQGPPDLVRYR